MQILYMYHIVQNFDGGKYCIHGLFGGDFNLTVWQIFIGLPNLNYTVVTPTHETNYLPFCQIKMTPTLFFNKSPNIQLANKSTYMVLTSWLHSEVQWGQIVS